MSRAPIALALASALLAAPCVSLAQSVVTLPPIRVALPSSAVATPDALASAASADDADVAAALALLGLAPDAATPGGTRSAARNPALPALDDEADVAVALRALASASGAPGDALAGATDAIDALGSGATSVPVPVSAADTPVADLSAWLSRAVQSCATGAVLRGEPLPLALDLTVRRAGARSGAHGRGTVAVRREPGARPGTTAQCLVHQSVPRTIALPAVARVHVQLVAAR